MIQEVLDRFAQERCSAIPRTNDQGVARQAMQAAVRGGFTLVEFTMTVPGALELIEEFAAKDGLIVGAGTVLEPQQARMAVQAGARFLVSPIVDPEIIGLAHELGAVAIPGTSSPTEMVHATRVGAQIVKLFPAHEKGPAYVKACLGPLPHLRILPTSGVTADNVTDFLRAGSFGVGFVAPLFDPQELAAREFDCVEQRARDLIARVRAS